ncbi:glycosyltransferase family 2 protein [Pedobacter mendelii]|uniref:Glycosyltransferase 2-like domain-containing protein n=1 Tax=Pedobacter mendelii TaxID=1908240 RepID=A0ABQ2BKE3_9SPHI|nr:glycosyltransferase family 2 protein [Pedobacter mendelii]GGI28259.1 hypothetical protein GCM10008119_31750 [Pedobacter mendelii]
MENIKLSICIPTYNRAEYLDLTLETITCQSVFTKSNDIEIVISDNCSSDHTEEIARKYIKDFGNKIVYFKNEENLADKNFELVLSRGRGLYLKLNNDTLTHTSNTLNCILQDVYANIESRNELFYLNQGLDKSKSILCNNLDEFINKAAYFGGWIGSFGIWKEDFDKMKEFSRYAKLLLTQTDVLYRLISNKGRIYVNNEMIFLSQDSKIKHKGGYDLITIFLDNHSFILNEYVEKNQISTTTYKKLTSKLLLIFLRKYLVMAAVDPDKYRFKSNSPFSRIIKFYNPRYLLLFRFFTLYYTYLIFSYLKKAGKWILPIKKKVIK